MPSVQVKDFPQELYDELKAYAEAQHRSMSQQLVVAAERMLRDVRAEVGSVTDGATDTVRENDAQTLVARRKALFARIDASTERARRRGTWKDGGPDAAALIREDRESEGRHGGGPVREDVSRLADDSGFAVKGV